MWWNGRGRGRIPINERNALRSLTKWFDKKGILHPLKFRFKNLDDSNFVVKVDRVITKDKEKLAGNEMLCLGVKVLYKV